MRTPEQLKGQIRSFAKKHKLMSQEVLQMYLFERLLERLAASEYKDNFILKSGLLISSMLGINERTTMDILSVNKWQKRCCSAMGSLWNQGEHIMIEIGEWVTQYRKGYWHTLDG